MMIFIQLYLALISISSAQDKEYSSQELQAVYSKISSEAWGKNQKKSWAAYDAAKYLQCVCKTKTASKEEYTQVLCDQVMSRSQREFYVKNKDICKPISSQNLASLVNSPSSSSTAEAPVIDSTISRPASATETVDQ